MRPYRLFHLGPDGRLRLGAQFVADNDDRAVEVAGEQRAFGEVVEVWDQGRLVGRVTACGVSRRH